MNRVEHKIRDIKNELWAINHINPLCGMDNLKKELKANNKDPSIYTMERIIEGTRKKPKSIQCYRSSTSDEFISVL